MQYKEIINELCAIYERKNHDYGDSFSKTCDEFGLVAAVVRMNDKMERIKTLTKTNALVDESLRDTLLDLANYSILSVMELDKRKPSDSDNPITIKFV